MLLEERKADDALTQCLTSLLEALAMDLQSARYVVCSGLAGCDESDILRAEEEATLADLGLIRHLLRVNNAVDTCVVIAEGAAVEEGVAVVAAARLT